jgi:hypothetical protein
MNHKSDNRGGEEQTRKRSHHLPETAESPIVGEQGGGVTETARSLRRIGDEPRDRAEGTLYRIS